jgi:hypothetical protein
MTCGEVQRHRNGAGSSTTRSGPACLRARVARLWQASDELRQGLRGARQAMAGPYGSDQPSCSPDLRPAWEWCRRGQWGCSFRRANQVAAAFRPLLSTATPTPLISELQLHATRRLSSPAPTSCRSLPAQLVLILLGRLRLLYVTTVRLRSSLVARW